MKTVIVLGAGMVGSAMALDLISNFKVTAADRDTAALAKLSAKNPAVETIEADLADSGRLAELVAPYNYVVNATPGFMGYSTLETVIKAGKDVVDIAFFPEDALQLDILAKENGVTAIMDIGVAPGVGNLVLGHWDKRMKIHTFECLVGGLPKVRKWPFAYKAPFSPIDVLEEYTRPARYVENSEIIIREALSDPELVDFEEVGTLESFNTDGLRSIIHTMSHIPNLKEKTLRFPGHIEYIRVLRETGFFSTEPMEINGAKVSPMDFTSRLLFKEWKLGDTEPEFTIMRVTVEGTLEDKPKKLVYHLYDEYDPATQTSSMARTTGYTATAALNMIHEGKFNEAGVFPPELVGKHDGCLDYILAYLEDRNVIYRVEDI